MVILGVVLAGSIVVARRVVVSKTPPPIIVSLTSSNGPLQVFGGVAGIFFVMPDDSLWRWAKRPEQVGTDHNWARAIAANNHCLALRRDGTLWEWGHRLGQQRIAIAPEQVGADNDWVSIAAGDVHSVALKRNGTVWAWGHNGSGQLGSPGPDRPDPVRIGMDTNWVAIGCSQGSYTFAVKADGTLWAWGQFHRFMNGSGPLALAAPTQVNRETNWLGITERPCVQNRAGELWWPFLAPPDPTAPVTHNCMLVSSSLADHLPVVFVGKEFKAYKVDADGTLWRTAVRDKLGARPSLAAKWQRVGHRSDWVSMWEAGGSVLAITRDGTVWAWGLDYSQEPVLDWSSKFRRIKARLSRWFGFGFSGLTTSATPVYREEPRPLMRLTFSRITGSTRGSDRFE